MHKTQKWVIAILLSVFSSLTLAANQLLEYSIKEAMNTEDARLRLGDSVKFYFGEKPANLSGRAIVVSKVRRKTMRDKENACHWAFLSSLLKLKEEAIERNSHYVVNIASNYKNNVILSKDKYQCALGLVAAEVALKGELMEPSATLSNVVKESTTTYSKPVDISDAILTPEPIITPRSAQPQTRQVNPPVVSPQVVTPQAVPSPQSQSGADLGRSVEDRLRVLKELHEAGEIDQKTYEAQRQRILDGI